MIKEYATLYFTFLGDVKQWLVNFQLVENWDLIVLIVLLPSLYYMLYKTTKWACSGVLSKKTFDENKHLVPTSGWDALWTGFVLTLAINLLPWFLYLIALILGAVAVVLSAILSFSPTLMVVAMIFFAYMILSVVFKIALTPMANRIAFWNKIKGISDD